MHGYDMGKAGPYMTHFGNAMGRMYDDMELIWVIILPNFKLWKMYGKKF